MAITLCGFQAPVDMWNTTWNDMLPHKDMSHDCGVFSKFWSVFFGEMKKIQVCEEITETKKSRQHTVKTLKCKIVYRFARRTLQASFATRRIIITIYTCRN